MASKISFIDLAKTVLAKASSPMTAGEIWSSGVNLGLDQQLETTGKTPEATLGARLYMAVKNSSNTGIIGHGNHPKRFSLDLSLNCSQKQENDNASSQHEAITSAASAKTFSFTECAQKVLEQFGNKKPMHYGDITTKALEVGWLASSGLTPEATMYAQILSEIQRKQKRGEQSRFVKHGHGYVGLSRWMGKGLRFQIEEHNKNICKQLHKFLMTISPEKFEDLIGLLLVAMGYEDTLVTGRSGDGGIDVRGTWVVTEGVRIRMAVQVKRWKNNVTRPVVQNLRGSISTNERGLIITTSDFPQSAIEEANDPTKASPISLINGEQLVRLFVEHEIGITRESAHILELNTGSIDCKNTEEKSE